jgi:hypothetical protein
MFHIRSPILKVFGIILGGCYCCSWDIPRSMALVLEVSKLLAMAKDIGGLRPITIGEVFLWFISHSIVL